MLYTVRVPGRTFRVKEAILDNILRFSPFKTDQLAHTCTLFNKL